MEEAIKELYYEDLIFNKKQFTGSEIVPGGGRFVPGG